jgi:hypothetical protein
MRGVITHDTVGVKHIHLHWSPYPSRICVTPSAPLRELILRVHPLKYVCAHDNPLCSLVFQKKKNSMEVEHENA